MSKIGDRLVVDIGDESILILRNRDNELRAFTTFVNIVVRNYVMPAVRVLALQSLARITLELLGRGQPDRYSPARKRFN